MSQIILDISANTFKNDMDYAKRMINEVYRIDSKKHEVIFKTQLFEKAGENIVLDHNIFDKLYRYCESLGYKLTSSVFDLPSLKFLLNYDIPFVKIANNRKLDWLIGEVQRKIEVYVSRSIGDDIDTTKAVILCGVSKYPASIGDYKFNRDNLEEAISDHTTNWDLFNKYEPEIYECHYVLEHDENNLDGGLFARTIDQLKEVL